MNGWAIVEEIQQETIPIVIRTIDLPVTFWQMREDYLMLTAPP